MRSEKFAEIVQNLVYVHGRIVTCATAQKAQVSIGDLDAAGDLACDAGEPVLNYAKLLTFQMSGIADALVNHFDKARDDRQRPVDVMNDAGVNFTPRARHLLPEL